MTTALDLAPERSIVQLFKDTNLKVRDLEGLDELLARGAESSLGWIFLPTLLGSPNRYSPVYTAEDGTRYRFLGARIFQEEIVLEDEIALPGGDFEGPFGHTIAGLRLVMELDIGSPERE